MKHYTLAVDPPWNERGGGKIKRGADRHYPLLKDNIAIQRVLEDDCELWPHHDDYTTASLWMWATANYLDDAIRLCGMLGFEYVTNAVWVKAERFAIRLDPEPGGSLTASSLMGECNGVLDVISDGETGHVVVNGVNPQAPGLGQRLRMCHEHLLYARAGKVPSPPPAHRMPSVIYAPRTKHSAKPQEAYDLMQIHDEGVVDSIVGRDGSPVFDGWERREFFARAPRPGWEVWGNEV